MKTLGTSQTNTNDPIKGTFTTTVNMKQTAVEWLKSQIELMLMDMYKSYPNELEEIFEIAKEMEEEQMKKMYLKGIENYDPIFKNK